jgi:hypothetical protein
LDDTNEKIEKNDFYMIIYKRKIKIMQITLNTPKKVVLQEEKSKTVSTLTVQRVVDLPVKKVVRCFVEELDEPVVLWEGTSYDAAGQWTDTDVEARLTELYS